MDLHDQLESQHFELAYLRSAHKEALQILADLYEAFAPPDTKPTSVDRILDIIDGQVGPYVMKHHPDWAPDV